MPGFNVWLQVKLVVALAVLHNIIRMNGGASDYWEQIASEEDGDGDDEEEALQHSPEPEEMASRRDAISEAMWLDYQEYLQHRV